MPISASHYKLALKSLAIQWREFSHSLVGYGAENHSNEEAICHVDGLTSFYFETNNWVGDNCEGTDWVVLVILVGIIHVFSWSGRWILWEPLARSIARRTGKDLSHEDLKRFSTCMTECSFFCISGFCAYRILSKKSWIYEPLEWNSYLYDANSNYLWLETDFKFYYLLYMARFISDTLSLPFEDRRWDARLTSLVHHVVTLGLVYGSAVQGLTRMGGVIMFFFDWTDPPLLVAKSLKYLSQDEKDIFQQVANRLFEAFAVTFILTRNVLYNYVVYIGVRDLPEWAWECRSLLVVLAGLQTYWLYLLLKVVQRQLATGVVSDVREDKKEA